jgi:hypothetical protein
MEIAQIIKHWDSGEGRPYKGSLIDWSAHQADPGNVGCMCAQGQVLHFVGGWDYEKLQKAQQCEADAATAELLGISRAHAILLRNVNDSTDGAPSIVLTDPGKVLGGHWGKLLDFWWMFHRYSGGQWGYIAAAWKAAGDAAWAAAGAAARAAARDAAWKAAGDAAWDAARDAARDAAWDAARDAARVAAGVAAGAAAGDAAGEIRGYDLLIERGCEPFFLPMFGIQTLDDIPPRPANYGNGIVPR